MRLRLETSERAPYWLVGDPDANERTEHSSAIQESVEIMRNQQILTGAEWDGMVAFDRGNQRITLNVTTRREFASEWARMDFLRDLGSANPATSEHLWAGDVWMRLDHPTLTGYFKEWQLEDAVIALAGNTAEGAVGLRLSYRIQAAGFADLVRELQLVTPQFVTAAASAKLEIVDVGLKTILDPLSPSTGDILRIRIVLAGETPFVLDIALADSGAGIAFPYENEIPDIIALAAPELLAAGLHADCIRQEATPAVTLVIEALTATGGTAAAGSFVELSVIQGGSTTFVESAEATTTRSGLLFGADRLTMIIAP